MKNPTYTTTDEELLEKIRNIAPGNYRLFYDHKTRTDFVAIRRVDFEKWQKVSDEWKEQVKKWQKGDSKCTFDDWLEGRCRK